MAKRLIFNLFVMDTIGHTSHGIWRHPQSRSREYKTLDLWEDLAVKAEKAKIDAVFFADILGIKGEYKGSQDIVFEMAVHIPVADPSMLISALARATEDLGFVFTSSVIQHHPFVFARMISTLDHLSNGRVGWNIVTSANESAYLNLGLKSILSHEERYKWAEEFVEVVYKLWEGSWEEGAVVNDPVRGIYADPRKVHKISHVGERYKVDGFHLMEPSPQRTPVLFQAGGSAPGLQFATRHGEAVLITALSPEAAHKQISTMREMARAQGRSPADMLFLQSMKFVVGSTEREAKQKKEELDAYLSREAQTGYYSSLSGVDLGLYDPQIPLEELIDKIPGIRGAFAGIISSAPNGSKPTLQDFLMGAFERTNIVGTPESIADALAAYQMAGIDGIQILHALLPGSYEDFFEHVVPVLQKRGLMQTEYRSGVLREKLFSGRGPHIADTHPAAEYRHGGIRTGSPA